MIPKSGHWFSAPIMHNDYGAKNASNAFAVASGFS
jgi:hypothetical protein